MSILINMEMPKGCASCFLKYGSCASIRKRMDVSKGDRWCPENYRHPDCPLIEVPPHGDLIDKDETMNEILEERGEDNACWFAGIVNDMPAVIPSDKDGETWQR